MPLLRKQPFIRNKPPVNIKGDHEIFFCEATKEMFLDYDQFFQERKSGHLFVKFPEVQIGECIRTQNRIYN